MVASPPPIPFGPQGLVALFCLSVKYALLRQVLARRQTFFDDMQALTRSMVFPSWQHFMAFMISGLELESKLSPDLRLPLNTS
jgi:hypothetical protein